MNAQRDLLGQRWFTAEDFKLLCKSSRKAWFLNLELSTGAVDERTGDAPPHATVEANPIDGELRPDESFDHELETGSCSVQYSDYASYVDWAGGVDGAQLANACGTAPTRTRRKGRLHPAQGESEFQSLPSYQRDSRVRSNVLVRSAVFGICARGERRIYGSDGQLEKIEAYTGAKISGIGVQLDPADMCTFDTIVAYAQRRDVPVSEPLRLKVPDLLRSMPRANGGPNRQWLRNSLHRLQQFELKITGNCEFTGSLVQAYATDDASGELIISLNPHLGVLYAAGLWTRQPLSYLVELKSKPLSLWVCSFYSTHANPSGMRVDNILKWSGSRSKSLKSFKSTLSAALKICEDATKKGCGDIVSHAFVGNLVNVIRTPSAPQSRHLARRRNR